MFSLPIDPAILILGIALVVVLYLYFKEQQSKAKLQRETHEFIESIPEDAWNALEQSIQTSRDMVGEAELESVKILAGTKISRDKLENEYNKRLMDLTTKTEGVVTEAKTQFLNFLADLEKKSQAFEETSRKVSENKINQLFEGLESKLSDFLIKTETSTTSSIELELKSTRSLIDTYKEQQLKLIDENIVAILEQTLSLVLGKKLTLSDQVDLVYQSLERAKVEKFIL